MILNTYLRVFVDADMLEVTRAFYRTLLDGCDGLRFSYPEQGLELAAVTSAKLSVLIIAGPPEARAPFEATRLTIQVEALAPQRQVLLSQGAEQLEPVQATPVGAKMRFRHPDGLVVEYVENHEASSKE